MKRIKAVLLSAGLVVMPLAGVVAAQQTPEHEDRPRSEWARRGQRFDMVGRLLEMRSELNLSGEQVERLTRIREKYAERNRPIIERLRDERREYGNRDRDSRREADDRDRDSRREADDRDHDSRRRGDAEDRRADSKEWREAHPEAARARDELRENVRSMREEIRSVLTDDQRQELKRQWRDHRRHDERDRDHRPTR